MIRKGSSRWSFILTSLGVAALLLAAPASVLADSGGGHGPNSSSPGASAEHGNSGSHGQGHSGSSSTSSSSGASGSSQQSNSSSNSSGSNSSTSSSQSPSGSNNSAGNYGPPPPTTNGSSSPGTNSGSSSTSAGDNNHGDVWLDNVGQPAGPGHEHDPHLACSNINLWGNFMADSAGTYTIDGWSPSGSGFSDQAYPASGTQLWSYTGSGDQIMSVINVGILIADAQANGDAPINGQGYHFKLQFSQDPQKHKTFWVNCPAPTPPPPPGTPGVSVDKTNNASGQGYGKNETATGVGETVPFQAVITNTSDVSETIKSITDNYPGIANGTPASECSGLIGTTLAPAGQAGDTVTCSFSITGYAPAAGTSLTDTVTVGVTAGTKTASGSSSSTVTTPRVTPPTPGSPGVSVDKTNDANLAGYGKIEFGTAKETVPFRAVITNTSRVSETITLITDSYSGHSYSECGSLVSAPTTLAPAGQPGDTVTCYFSVTGYGPAAGSSLTDTVTVDVAAHNQTASASSSSTVITPGPPTSGGAPILTVTKAVDTTSTTLGQTLNYTITVTNSGTAAATDVVMNDVMSGTAAVQVNDGTHGTRDSFSFSSSPSGAAAINFGSTGPGSYTWEYASLAVGQTATVTYSATMLAPGNLSTAVNGLFSLTNAVTATSGDGGCTTTASCTATVTTTAPTPKQAVLGASTTKKTPAPAGAVLGASTPGTGAHLDLLLTLILVLAGLSLLGLALLTRRRAKTQA